jgi:hypothetical protein
MLRCHLNSMQWAAEVVPENAQKQIACLLNAYLEKLDRLCKSLVNGLVETHHLVKLSLDVGVGVYPHAQNAGAQRAIFRGQLTDVESAVCSQNGMRLSGRLGGAHDSGLLTEGLFDLCGSALVRLHILCYSAKDLFGVIAQRERVHVSRRRKLCRSERLPRLNDGGEVTEDELSKSHFVGCCCQRRLDSIVRAPIGKSYLSVSVATPAQSSTPWMTGFLSEQ